MCERQSVSVTDNLCLSPTVSVCHRHSVSATDSLLMSQTVYVHQRQFFFYLSQKIFVFHRRYVSVTDSMCLSQLVCVCPKHSIFVTDSLCLSQIVYVCHRKFWSLSLSNTHLDHSLPGSYLLTQNLGTNITNFVDPWLESTVVLPRG